MHVKWVQFSSPQPANISVQRGATNQRCPIGQKNIKPMEGIKRGENDSEE